MLGRRLINLLKAVDYVNTSVHNYIIHVTCFFSNKLKFGIELNEAEPVRLSILNLKVEL